VAFAVFSAALRVCIFCFTTALAASRSLCALIAAWKIAVRTACVMLWLPRMMAAVTCCAMPAMIFVNESALVALFVFGLVAI
jgi:hypothetical protein